MFNQFADNSWAMIKLDMSAGRRCPHNWEFATKGVKIKQSRPRACQDQLREPLILQGCSLSGLSKINPVCVQVKEIHTVPNYLTATAYYTI